MSGGSPTGRSAQNDLLLEAETDWQRRVVGRSLRTAAERSVDRGMNLIRAAATVLARSDGEDITVQEVAEEAGQSLRTLYQYFESKDDLLLAVFEEAMRSYALLIEQSISGIDDPLERLAGAIVAAVRMPGVTGSELDRGLVRLRLRLSQTRPDLVGRAQAAVTALLCALVEAAGSSGAIDVSDPESAAFMILSINAAFITTGTIGNDAGVHRPEINEVASFCMRGLGAQLEHSWYESIDARLQFPTTGTDRGSRTNGARRRSATRHRATKKS
jgi:AcrR family transcriptional regulator